MKLNELLEHVHGFAKIMRPWGQGLYLEVLEAKGYARNSSGRTVDAVLQIRNYDYVFNMVIDDNSIFYNWSPSADDLIADDWQFYA